MRAAAPNALDTMQPIHVMVKLDKRSVVCLLTRVYYHDTQYERRLWVDVKVVDQQYLGKQKTFLHLAMENLDHRYYAKIVALSFLQEEFDIAFQRRLKDAYACHIDMRLTQEYDSIDGYYWQGVMGVSKRPSLGHVYVRGINVPIYRFAHICITPDKPLILCVKQKNRIKVESKIAIRMGHNNVPLVSVDGIFMHVTVHIGGKLFSCRNGISHSLALERADHGSPTTAL